MMKSRLSLKNLARAALNNSLILIICLATFSSFSCSYPSAPTYTKDKVTQAIQDICKKEYGLDVKARLVGETFWVYLPLEDIFIKSEKPEKSVEKFDIAKLENIPSNSSLKFAYQISPIPDKETLQEYQNNKPVIEKIDIVWRVIRRLIFSADSSKPGEPKFFALIAADIKNGFEVMETFYYIDLKKASYNYIAREEFQHRVVQESRFIPQAIGDKEGRHVMCRDITLKEFILAQIRQRIQLKFQRPEVDKNTDIDKEIEKIALHTIKTYVFKDFEKVELTNLFTNKKIVLDKAGVWANSI